MRVFAKGFFTTHGVIHNFKFMFDFFGKFHYEEDRTRSHDYLGKCEVTERRPTFIISHDDIFNLGHHMNNVMNVWQMSVLAGNNTKDSLLINFDGFRENGPAGGDAHRLMSPSDVDSYIPYNYHESCYQETRKAVQYNDQHVRFNELYVLSNPFFSWFWNDWRKESKCATLSPSPLYQ